MDTEFYQRRGFRVGLLETGNALSVPINHYIGVILLGRLLLDFACSVNAEGARSR